ncbi:cytochrome b5-like heme/steroid binding domain-containing protein [Franzmannia qiaohouensis]|uniref:Cytochrome b5-like heme/steroid binding domain-containing protein n=1 Tax=Franzmannia qiaohouensis TaxID=1329370 RepID=A0ABU1HIE8_9GAMM|nr:cytochrome b5-like heme/steroid binding domain-containing protein [Halomonas qiaohouensis]MDR5906554.1 cytochrome b5-like heme/steroid binding domain-containing protein [Halomonas qiaohouensis]
MNKFAYSAFIAFLASIGTLVSVHALSSDDETDGASETRDITLDELAEHASAESCWKAIHGGVYDITDYVPDHPTEEEVILEWCGRESSEAWDNKSPGRPHSPGAERQLENYRIGRLVDDQGEPLSGDVEETSADAERQDARPAASVSPAEDQRLHQAMLGQPMDGHYRGVFTDRGEIQVNITFDLRDGHLTDVNFRHLAYRGVDYLTLEEGDDLYPVMVQHRRITEWLEGEPLTAIFALYEPARVVDEVDGFSGATLRGAKVISAMRDGLNRGVYSWP